MEQAQPESRSSAGTPQPWSGVSACMNRLRATLAELVGQAPRPGAFGEVVVQITPAQDAHALPVHRWVNDVKVLVESLKAIEPTARVSINVTGVGMLHHQALRNAGVEVGTHVVAIDYAPVLKLIPEALRPCTRCGLPTKPVELSSPSNRAPG